MKFMLLFHCMYMYFKFICDVQHTDGIFRVIVLHIIDILSEGKNVNISTNTIP
jgi:hypothetical protein